MKTAASKFQHYELTEEEIVTALGLGPLTEALIRDTQATVAEKLLSLQVDPALPNSFVAEHAYVSGQLSALSWLLEAVEAVARKEVPLHLY